MWTATHDADYRVIVHDMDVGQIVGKTTSISTQNWRSLHRGLILWLIRRFPNEGCEAVPWVRFQVVSRRNRGNSCDCGAT